MQGSVRSIRQQRECTKIGGSFAVFDHAYLVCAKLTCRRTVLSKLLTALSPKFRLARTTAGKSYRGLSTGKEQPVRLLLVDQPVVIRDRLDADLLEDLAECIGER